ncbi:MAG: hypothetical protein CBC28_01850 [Flavobacteriaceae bacterium TMED68]|nr:MAG: hypothetical protein CBC28_01850 [Flavobacteriaceae bacterium TMED68]
MSEFWEGDLKTGYYDKVLTSGLKKNRGIQANWHNITFSRVKKYLSKNISHLDYACGSGSLIGLYSQSSSVGFDISENQINYANSTYQGKGNFYTIDNLDLREHHEKYDIITVLGLLEFLENEENIKIINNLYSLLKPNGKLILTTPNFTSTMYVLEKALNIFGSVNYEDKHINKFNKSRLLLLLNQSKFQNIKIDKYINFPVFLSFMTISLSCKLNLLVEKLLNKKVGYLLFAELTKTVK